MKDTAIYKIFNKMQDDISESCLADKEYLTVKKSSYDLENKLMTELPVNQKETVKMLIDTLTAIGFAECRCSFYNGFKAGANLILEILK